MITSAIEANRKNRVACIDTPKAYLNVLMDEEEIMILRGPLSKLMVMVETKPYPKFVTYYSKWLALLYVKIDKSLYGFL